MDLFPTACDLSGISAPPGLDGLSLLPLLRGEKDRLRETLFFAYRDVQRAVQDERWKLIEYEVRGARTTQLFDLAADPHETRNRADDPAAGGELARLRGALGDWRKKLDDPALK